MKLTALDWAIVAAYFLFNLAVGFYYKARAGKNTGEFFLGGRNVPVVAGGHIDGGDHVRRRHAAGRNGHGRAERNRRQLALVELSSPAAC